MPTFPWKPRVRRLPLVIAALSAAALLALYSLAGFVLVPYWIERNLPRYADSQLGRSAVIGKVRINPFLLKFDARGFEFKEKDGRPILAFDRLLVDLEWKSLFRRAWTFTAVRLEQPRLDLDIDPAGTLNLAALIRQWAPAEPPDETREDPETPRLLLREALVSDATLSLTDRSGRTPAAAALRQVSFDLRDIATLREREGTYRVTGRLPQGGAFALNGRLSLEPMASSGKITFKSFKIATLWRFLRDELRITEPTGDITGELEYVVHHADDGIELRAPRIEVQANGLEIRALDAPAPLLSLASATLQGGDFDLKKRTLSFREVTATNAKLAAARGEDGTLDWQHLVAMSPAPDRRERPPRAGAKESAWRIRVESARLDEMSASFLDRTAASPASVELAKTSVSLAAQAEFGPGTQSVALDRVAIRTAGFKYSAGPSGRARSVEGAAAELGFALKAKLEGGSWMVFAENLIANAAGLRYQDAAGRPAARVEAATASAGFSARFTSGDSGGFAASAIKARMSDLKVGVEGRPELLLVVTLAELDTGALDLAQRRVALGKLTVRDGAAFLVREPDGTIPLVRSLLPAPAAGTAAAPFNFSVKHAELTGFNLAVGDTGADFPVRYDLNGVRFALRDFATGAATASRFDFAAGVNQGGALKARGEFQPKHASAKGQINVSDLALTPLARMLANFAQIELVSGQASAEGRFSVAPREGKMVVRYDGGLELNKVRLDDPNGKQTVMAWSALTASGIALSPDADDLSVKEVQLSEPRTRLVISKDRSVNLASFVKPRETRESKTAPQSESEFRMRVERLRISKGEVDFADHSLVLPFSTRVHELAGVLSGLSTRAGSRTTIQLEGRADKHGHVRVSGTVDLPAPSAFANVTAAFRNIAMAPLTPYSATFAGRKIVSGRLALDLNYQLKQKALLGENKIVVENLVLGERVESPSALDLPLDLAIALLSDSEGRIRMAIPVTGDVGRPEFTYGHIVGEAIGKALTGVVTAPFRALAAIFGGGGGENLDRIGFEPGSARLLPPEQEKLQRLAKTLMERPRLRLQVTGTYDTERDSAALREEALRREVATRLGVKSPLGQRPDPINYDSANTRRVLETLLLERVGPVAAGKILGAPGPGAPREPKAGQPEATAGKPRSPEAHRAGAKELVRLQPLPSDTFDKLGRARSAAIIRELRAAGGIAPARLEALAPEAAEADKGEGVFARLAIGVHQQTSQP